MKMFKLKNITKGRNGELNKKYCLLCIFCRIRKDDLNRHVLGEAPIFRLDTDFECTEIGKDCYRWLGQFSG